VIPLLEENLQMGDSGNNVRILQEKLKILGFYNAIITGDFGLATEEGVKAFQKEQNLEETGIVDENLWEMLLDFTDTAYTTLSNYPTLSYGSSGTYVTELQTKLKALLYYTGPTNSIFDLETETAVKRFQFHNDITTTGIVNNQTWSFLNALYGNLNQCVTGTTGSAYIPYIVKPGDTLYSIAMRYNTTVDAIKTFNNLTSNILEIGQELKIPTQNENATISYTVQPGDTLYSIARKYNTTVSAIKNLNNLTSDILRIGQILQIPTTSSDEPSTITYTVKSGDTLYAIAMRYNTTVDAIKTLNNLTSNTLRIGQTLQIPTASSNEPSTITYTVRAGDTLYAIAMRYNTTVNAIKTLNNLTSNTLQIGQKLKIPV